LKLLALAASLLALGGGVPSFDYDASAPLGVQ
jgi:hypothetical protein